MPSFNGMDERTNCEKAELPIAAVIDAIQLLLWARPRLAGHLRSCPRCECVLLWTMASVLHDEDYGIGAMEPWVPSTGSPGEGEDGSPCS